MLITKIHLSLQQIVVCITTLIFALLISVVVQDASRNPALIIESGIPIAFASIAVLWVLLCVPRLRFDAIVAPRQPLHLLAQCGLGVLGSIGLAMASIFAALAPLSERLLIPQFGVTFALCCGASVALLAVAGMIRALTDRSSQDHTAFESRFRTAHRRLAQASAVIAAMIAIPILGSVLIAGRPTTNITMTNAVILLVIAVLLAWPRFTIPSLKHPSKSWHIAPQLLLAGIAVHVIERITRAFSFHSQLFESFAEIDAIYPALENLFMAPFIIFGLIGIALALPPIRETQGKPSVSQVFG